MLTITPLTLLKERAVVTDFELARVFSDCDAVLEGSVLTAPPSWYALSASAVLLITLPPLNQRERERERERERHSDKPRRR